MSATTFKRGGRVVLDRATRSPRPGRLTGELQDEAARLAYRLKVRGHSRAEVARLLHVSERHVKRLRAKVPDRVRRAIEREERALARERTEIVAELIED